MEVDPLLALVGNFATPASLGKVSHYEPLLFLDGGRFLNHISGFTKVDVMTYSQGKYDVLGNVDRLIYGLKKRVKHKCREVRFVPNNHIKLFICYTTDVPVAVYVGSLNLTQGTNLNIMYAARPEHHQSLINLFETIWNQAL